jgi:hypothetical protein
MFDNSIHLKITGLYIKSRTVQIKLSALVCILSLLLHACKTEEARVEDLVKNTCSSCHLFPEPDLLPKDIWLTQVLPNMAFRMGLVDLMDGLAYVPQQDLLTVISTLPKERMVNEDEWAQIINYYKTNSPDTLPSIPESSYEELTTQFTLTTYHNPSDDEPLVTLIKFDSLRQQLVYGTRNSKLIALDKNLNKITELSLTSPPSAIEFSRSSNYLALMGIMDPNDQEKGTVISWNGPETLPIIDSLKRPVHIELKNLNNDSRKDFIISAFGNYTGNLSVYESQGGDRYKQHLLSALPGARMTVVKDVNHDSLPDIIALFTQGDEQLTLFINKGNFQFQSQVLLRFPSVYGSTHFEVVDFDKDGNQDILYANGDNSDYSQILKPYHGIRIFRQTADWKFEEFWFVPLHGASKAIARDFDQDGDLDIVAIAYFPDFNSDARRNFVYYENKNNQFTPNILPETPKGRWIVMDVGDIDNDNDLDIFLGALNFNTKVPKGLSDGWKNHPVNVLILKNNLHAE